MNIKEQLYQHCLAHTNQKIQNCVDRIDSIKNDLSSETKSSAGDKHETGRAMLQLEREKLGNQLAIIEQEKNVLKNFDTNSKHTQAKLGSIVRTSQHYYFILISAGVIKINQENFISISMQSPIDKLLMGKTVGDQITFRDNSFEILNIR